MTNKLQRLELTWPGKDERINPEPRILLEDKEKSYFKPAVKTDLLENSPQPTFDNMLIHGDNLLALKALEQDFAGKVKCIYIDPPFNTGSAFEHYDDGLEHSIWLSLMRDRLEILKRLLSRDGVIWIHIDDKEMAYLKIIMDEVFLRKNFLNMIVIKTSDPSGLKTVNPSPYSQTEYILMYAKDRSLYIYDPQYVPSEYDPLYNKIITNISEPYHHWRVENLNEYLAHKLGYTDAKEAKLRLGKLGFYEKIASFALEHSNQVYQATAISEKAGQAIIELKNKSLGMPDKVMCLTRSDYDDIYLLNGRQIYFYENKIKKIDGLKTPTKPLTNLWTDIPYNGIANEGNVKFKNGKKPEKLIRRIIDLSTTPGDLVLDSFLGSGTTAAVAQKMGRRWIGVEMGDHVYTHCLPRLQKVINGEDQSGITKAVNWQGGGGFKFYELASSLIVKDKYGQQIISDKYNAEMLAEAMCKILDYHYQPDPSVYWKQGYSSEKSFIFTTTASLQETSLDKIAEEIGDNNLLICCSAFSGNPKAHSNISVKKIPAAILKKCEWGMEGYPLNLSNYTPDDPEFNFEEEE